MKSDNRGISLVELIASIAILALVSGAILGFFLFSTRQYHKGSSESTVQNEAQMVMGRLENLIINASDGVGTNAAGDVLYLFNHEVQNGGGGKTYICRRTTITLNNTTHQLMSSNEDYVMNPGDGSLTLTGSSTPAPIADYMDTAAEGAPPVFLIDLSKLATEQTASVTIRIKLREQSYSTTNQFVLRNRVSSSTTDSLEEHFKLENIKE